MISDILKETHAMLAMRRVFEGAAVVTFFLICVFTARSIWIVGVFKTYDSVVGHDAWKGMFVDPLDPDKSDCRALFARPASDDDFYPTSYIEHRGNFERELSRIHGEGNLPQVLLIMKSATASKDPYGHATKHYLNHT